nr:copper resistance CopC family protein [Motilibacter deserti]
MATKPAARRRVDRAARAGILAALTTAGVLGSALPAAAHGSLAESTPAEGTKVSEPVEVVDLYFTEPVDPGVAKFEVFAPNGERVDAGWWPGQTRRLREPVQEFNLVDGTWTPVFYDYGYGTQVALRQLPQKGTYRVTYSNVASDGDEVKGELKFNYTGAPTQPRTVQTPSPFPVQEAAPHAAATPVASAAAGQQPVTTPVPAPAAAAAQNEESGGLPTAALIGAAVVVLAAIVALRVLVMRRARSATSGPPASGRGGRPAPRPTPSRTPSSRSGSGSGGTTGTRKSRP